MQAFKDGDSIKLCYKYIVIYIYIIYIILVFIYLFNILKPQRAGHVRHVGDCSTMENRRRFSGNQAGHVSKDIPSVKGISPQNMA